MKTDKANTNETVIDGVRVVQDGDVTHFTIDDTEDTQKRDHNVEEKSVKEHKSGFEKLRNWWDNLWIKPYVNVRDFNRQGEDDMRIEDNPPATGVEVGIKISF